VSYLAAKEGCGAGHPYTVALPGLYGNCGVASLKAPTPTSKTPTLRKGGEGWGTRKDWGRIGKNGRVVLFGWKHRELWETGMEIEKGGPPAGKNQRA